MNGFDKIIEEVRALRNPATEVDAKSAREILEEFPLSDAMDQEILLHREVHFGGKFEVMIDYYEKGGRGVVPEFELKRIEQLDRLEKTLEENLASLILSGADAEKVQRARDAYSKFQELCEQENANQQFPRLIAEMILSEEHGAEKEIEAIAREGKKVIPYLLDLLKSRDFYDRAYPGYGQAPFLAAKCLGKIGDDKAIFTLFETVGEGDFSEEEMVVKALCQIGQPAKEFLLKVIRSTPYGEDNERAALVLAHFQDPEVSQACLALLEIPDVMNRPVLSSYLVLACEKIEGEKERQRFSALLEDSSLAPMLRRDIEAIVKSW